MKKAFLSITVVLLILILGLSSCVAPKATYRVVFEIDGETAETQEVKEGDYIIEPAKPSKAGYDFIGWYNNGSKWRFDLSEVTGNVLLEAKWKINLNKMFSSYDGSLGVELSNDGSYLSLDSNPYDMDDLYLSSVLTKIQEANKKLGFSDSLYQKMLNTSALQGRQTDSNDLVTVEWTYHPDNGLEVIYEVK